MYRQMWIAGFVFVVFFSVQNVILPNQVSAGWCGCGNCMMSITNPGSCSCSPPYYWCLEDLMALQLQASLHTYPVDVNSIPEAVIPTFTKPNLTEQVIYLLSGAKCLHNKLVSHLLGNSREGLKLIPMRFD
jgi:hypothetical protein